MPQRIFSCKRKSMCPRKYVDEDAKKPARGGLVGEGGGASSLASSFGR